MVHHERPITLLDLHKLIQTIDHCYWEQKAEVACKANPMSRVDPKNDLKTAKNPEAAPKGKALENPKPGMDLTGKLGKDGKLTLQGHQHRMDNSLCLFCRKTGHIAKECLKSSAITARARATIWSYRSPSWRRQKKIEQPPNPRTPWGLHLISSCTNYCHPQHLHHHS